MGNPILQLLERKNKDDDVQSKPSNVSPLLTHPCGECGEIFERPLVVTNLSKTPSETYYGCPRCLSKLNGFDEHSKETKKQSFLPAENKKIVEAPSPPGCPHYFGYLKNRPKGTPIPDACLTCKKIVQCLT